jgi:hypothetical protein
MEPSWRRGDVARVVSFETVIGLEGRVEGADVGGTADMREVKTSVATTADTAKPHRMR